MAIYYLLSGGDRKRPLFTGPMQTVIAKDLTAKQRLVSISALANPEYSDNYFYGSTAESGRSLGTVNTFHFSDLQKFYLIDGQTPREIGAALIQSADIIYLQGGDPFYQMDLIRTNGYDRLLRDFDGIILGLSAGSMNMGKTAYYSKDTDHPATCFYTGLGLVDITVDPHFDLQNATQVYEALQYSRKQSITGLPDYSMIRVHNENTSYHGSYYIFKGGKMTAFDNS